MEETFSQRKIGSNQVEVTKTTVVVLTRAQLQQELLTIEQNIEQHTTAIDTLTARKADLQKALDELGA